MEFLVQVVPVTDQNGKVVLVAGEVPGHLQSTVEVPLSSLPNAQGAFPGQLSHLPLSTCACVFICVEKKRFMYL